MLVQKYKDMLSGKSVIRQLSEYATARGKEVGYDNVFDYSLGNPSVPVPQRFTDTMIKLLQTESTSVELSKSSSNSYNLTSSPFPKFRSGDIVATYEVL